MIVYGRETFFLMGFILCSVIFYAGMIVYGKGNVPLDGFVLCSVVFYTDIIVYGKRNVLLDGAYSLFSSFLYRYNCLRKG